MQTNIAVHDTDKEQGNVMDSNPNRGTNHKEKRMNAIIRTTSVAVLVAPGLTLTAWAAEPDAKRFRLDAPPEVRKIPELARSKTDKRVWEKTGVELEFRVPKARLSAPPVWVEGVKTCEIELEHRDFGWKSGPVIPADWSGKRVKLFYSVSPITSGKKGAVARVMVNGRNFDIEGYSEFASMEFDITAAAKFGAENVIPTRSRGLAWLRALPPVNVSRLEVETTFDAQYRDATMEVSLEISNEGGEDAQDVRVAFELIGPDGKDWPTGAKELSLGGLKAGEGVALSPKIVVASPLPWDSDHPNLYRLRCALHVGGKKAEVAERRFGFRQVEVRGNGLYINNHRAKLRGAVSFWVQPGLAHNRHPLEVEAGRKALVLLRDANVNHLRPAWYAPVMIDLCDELGMTSVPGGNWGLGGRNLSIVEAQELATWMVATHKSNPSAIMWSVANEAWGPQYELMGRRFKELDRRPVCVSVIRTPANGLPGMDIDNGHYPSNKRMTEDVKNGRGWYFDEFCHTCTYNLTGREDDYDGGVHDQWGDMFEENWECAYGLEGVIGVATFAANGFERLGSNLLDHWNRPTAALWHVKKVFSPVRIAEAPLAVPEAGAALRIPVENRGEYSNLKEYRWQWRVGGQQGTISPDIAPRSKGELVVPAKAAAGQTLCLTVTDPRGFVINDYALPIGAVKAPALPPPSFTGAATLKRADKRIEVAGDGFRWKIDAASGLIVAGEVRGKNVVTGGPVVIGQRPWTRWKAAQVKAEQSGAGVRVTIAGEYAEGKGQFVCDFTGDGLLRVNYDFTFTGDIPTGKYSGGFREIGALLELDKSCDALRWSRKAKWTTYPEDHIGRPSGLARLAPSGHWPMPPEQFNKYQDAWLKDIEKAYRAFQPLPVPDYPWSQEETPHGAYDFSGTKYHIYWSELVAPSGAGLRAESDGSHSSRVRVEGDRIQFLVNDFSGSSHRSHLGWFKTIHRKVVAGDRVKGSVAFRLFQGEAPPALVAAPSRRHGVTGRATAPAEGTAAMIQDLQGGKGDAARTAARVDVIGRLAAKHPGATPDQQDEILTALRFASEEATSQVQAAAMEALDAIGDSEYEGRLTKALAGDGDKTAKALLCGVAERRKTTQAIPALRELSKSSDPALRAAAERALKAIEPRK